MDQDATWYGGLTRPRPHCGRWGPNSPPQEKGGHNLPFSVHVCCGQMAGWIKMPLVTKVGLGPGYIVLHGDPASLRKWLGASVFGPCLLWPIGRPSQLLLSTCWATFCKTVRPNLSDRCLSVLSVCLSVMSVCNVGVLWPNGWMDQEETWHAGRPRPWPHCVRWVPSSPSQKGGGAPNFRPMYCGQTAGWIKMALGMEVGLGPVHTVQDGDTARLPKRGQSHQFFRPMNVS